MKTGPSLQILERYFRKLLADGFLQKALAELFRHFDDVSDKKHLNAITLLLGDLSNLQHSLTVGTLTEAEGILERAKINGRTLYLLDEAFPSLADSNPEPKPVQKGKLLHNIPPVMPIEGKPVLCRVRIASKDEHLFENFYNPANIEPIPLSRIGEKMEVDLVSSDPDAFYIRQLHLHPEQIVEDDTYTEWVFEVTPIKEGHHVLILKVAIILETFGERQYKDHVLTVEVDVELVPQEVDQRWTRVAEVTPPDSRGGSFYSGIIQRFQEYAHYNPFELASVFSITIASFIGYYFWDVGNTVETHQPVIEIVEPPRGVRIAPLYIDVPLDTAIIRCDISCTVRAKGFDHIKRGLWRTEFIVLKDTDCYAIDYQGNTMSKSWKCVELPDTLHVAGDSYGGTNGAKLSDTLPVTGNTNTPENYNKPFVKVYLSFIQPIQFTRLDSNGRKMLQQPVIEEKKRSLISKVSFSVSLDTADSNHFRFMASGRNCQCEETKFNPPPPAALRSIPQNYFETTNIPQVLADSPTDRIGPIQQFNLQMKCKNLTPDPPPLPPPTECEISIFFDSKWQKCKKGDLSVWIDGVRYSGSISPDKENPYRFIREIQRSNNDNPLADTRRKICVKFHQGVASQTDLEIDCYKVPLQKEGIRLMLTNDNQLVRRK